MTPSRAGESLGVDDRAVSSVLGYALIIGIVLVSVVGIAALGATALTDTQRQSELSRAEHTMTLMDSRTAMVALGSSDAQTISFGTDSGRFVTRPDRGWLAIKHVNYTAGETEEVFNETLGAFVYRNGDTDIAYQGGGVWRKSGDGAAVMLSPPEFHYRAATLTLPIIRVNGPAESSTAPSATITNPATPRKVYPDSTGGTADGTGSPYDHGSQSPYNNPIENGTVEVHVHSEYYQGWASYFRERTSGVVEVFDSNQTVHLTLESLAGSLGRFPIPPENSDGVEVEGLASGHPVTDFRLNLTEGQTSGGENHWALYSTQGYNEFEIHLEQDYDACSARISIYYHNSSTNEREEWQTDGFVDESSTNAIWCTGDNMGINLSTENIQMEYDNIEGTSGSGTKFCFGIDIRDNPPDNTTLHEHDVDPGPGIFYDPSDGLESKNLNFTMNHYLGRLGTNFRLRVKDAQGNFCPSGSGQGSGGGSDTIDEGPSIGVLRFEESTAARYITYLHVTENRVEVDLG